MDRPLCQVCNKNLARTNSAGNYRPTCLRCYLDKRPQREPGPRPLCVACNRNLAARSETHKSGWRSKCKSCQGGPRYRGPRKRPWKEPIQKPATPTCAFCGFQSLHRCQMDMDHKDGDHSNTDPENLQWLCSNCHRLKTYLKKENLPRARRPEAP